MKVFAELQAELGQALALNVPGSTDEHVVVAMPSFSVGDTLLAHYGPRIPALEHRYVVVMGMLQRVPACELVFVGSQHPGQEVIEYYLSLMPPQHRADVRARFHVVTLSDPSSRCVAEKLCADDEARAEITRLRRGRPAFLEPWQVTEHEVRAAVALQMPLNGTDSALRPLAYKSAGRRLFRAAGVPLPLGHEDVRSVEDVLAAAARISRMRPTCTAVVVKHDDSGAGDGNVVLDLGADLRAQLHALPDWYLRDLRSGGVVEERIVGLDVTSPSAQLDLLPDGRVVLLATHEQELGGPDGQVYTGCRLPAQPAYAAEVGQHALAVGEELVRQGAIGRISVDFVASRNETGWSLYALEVNLRKGGTTHPYSTLRNHAPGSYDGASGRWVTATGGTRCYRATDNLVDAEWLGLPPAAVIDAVGRRGLHLDPASGTGVVLHMLSCLAVDGRFGLTAIGRDPGHASQLYDATREAVQELVRSSRTAAWPRARAPVDDPAPSNVTP